MASCSAESLSVPVDALFPLLWNFNAYFKFSFPFA